MRLLLLLAAFSPLAALAQPDQPARTSRPVCDSFGMDRPWCMAELRRQPNAETTERVPRAGARDACNDVLDPDSCRRRAAIVKPVLGPARLLR